MTAKSTKQQLLEFFLPDTFCLFCFSVENRKEKIVKKKTFSIVVAENKTVQVIHKFACALFLRNTKVVQESYYKFDSRFFIDLQKSRLAMKPPHKFPLVS